MPDGGVLRPCVKEHKCLEHYVLEFHQRLWEKQHRRKPWQGLQGNVGVAGCLRLQVLEGL